MPSVKRRSAKRLSVKRRSAKRLSFKKSSPKKVTSEYKMCGMGVLLNMYGGASEALEQQVTMKLKEIAELKRQLAVEKNRERMIQIQKAIVRIERDIQMAKEKMRHLLNGAVETVSKAAANLGTKKLSGTKLSRAKEDDYKPFSPSIPPAYSFKGGSKKYERRIEKRFVASSPSKISLSMTGSEK